MRVRVVVDNRIRVKLDEQVLPEVVEELKEKFSHPNPTYAKLKAMGYRFDHRAEPAVIRTWGEGGGWISFPRGGMGRVREVLSGAGLSWAVEDQRSEGDARWGPGFRWPEHLQNPDGSRRALYPDQEQVVDACIAKQNCVIRSGTGSGKTSSLLALAARLRLPTIIIVWTGGLFDQWLMRTESELGIDPRWIGRLKGGKRTYGPITIAMQQTIVAMQKRSLPGRHEDLFDRFGLLGFDECHKAGASSFYASVDPFTAKYRVGVSDDERRADRKDCLIYDLFGGVAKEVTREELVAAGRILDVLVRIVPTGWRPVSASPEVAEVAGEEEVDRSDSHALLAEMGASEERNALAVEHAGRYAREGHQVLVFSLRREHCARLAAMLGRAGVRAGLLLGGDGDQKGEFDHTLADLRSGALRVGVGTVQAVGTGIDLPAVSRGVVASPIAGNKAQLRQVWGRICRAAEGKDAELVYLYDERVFPDHFGKLSKASAAPTVWCAPRGEWLSPREWRKFLRAG